MISNNSALITQMSMIVMAVADNPGFGAGAMPWAISEVLMSTRPSGTRILADPDLIRSA